MAKQISIHLVYKFLIALGFISVTSSAQDRLALLIGDVKSGPSVYYSTDAYSHFTRTGQIIAPQVEREVAVKSYRAAVLLASMGSNATSVIPVLLDSFPKAYHVSEIRNVKYAGEGSFEDWIHTYITSEKNKFLLASPFLDYNSMSACEPFIECNHEIEYLDKAYGAKGPLNLTIIFTLHIGAYTLEKITGMGHGKDVLAWRKWWAEGGNALLSDAPSVKSTVSGPSLSSGQAFSEIVEKGKYRMSLSTGDELVGVVESKTDSSIVFETTDGKAFTFGHLLITRYELLAPPPSKKKAATVKKSLTNGESEVVSFEELQERGSFKGIVTAAISNGSVFKGTLVSINESMLTLNIQGSNIPIGKGVISKITLITPTQKQNDVKKTQGPSDTVFVKNSETDEAGNPKEDLVYVGTLGSMSSQLVTITLLDGSSKEIERAKIVRIIKNTASNYEETIKRYAKPLFCPDDMFLVDIPPGKQGRPFFKTCIDRFEYPNKRDVIPQGNVSYTDAQNYCEKQGKRLCSQDEWQWACSGLEGYTYPYGWNRDDIKCNTDATAERAGSRHNCVSKFGGYDMVGNIFEWVTGKGNEPMLMGGPYSKCQTVSPGVGGGAKPQTGFRCCKSN